MSSIRSLLLIAALPLLLSGCQKAHAGGSSGSNWLECETNADCSGAKDADRCGAEGYCVDERGNRVVERTLGAPSNARADASAPNDPADEPNDVPVTAGR